MKKYGFEQEFFLVRTKEDRVAAEVVSDSIYDNKGVIVVDDLVLPDDIQIVGYRIPTDSCGYLVEARGEPHKDIFQAVFSLVGEIEKIKSKLPSTVELSYDPFRKFSAKFLHEIQRRYVKGLSKYNNIYGHINHRVNGRTRTAGLHLSITDVYTHSGPNNTTGNHYQNFDYIKYILKLDEAFASEIKAAKRNPGFYEVKDDGRIEYRSLPTMTTYKKLLTTISEIDNQR